VVVIGATAIHSLYSFWILPLIIKKMGRMGLRLSLA